MSGTTKVVDREYLKQQFKNFNDILVKPKITDLDDRKVEKIPGKGLSKNDFTDDLKTKLEGLSNYDDTELVNAINTLNGDAQTQGSVAQMTADAVAAIVAGADASFDTLKEISDWIISHADSAAAMNTAINANTQAITVLNGDENTQGSVAHTVKEAMDVLAYEIEDVDIDFSKLEFTYTKTPGTISKIFVHLYRNTTSPNSNSTGDDKNLYDRYYDSIEPSLQNMMDSPLGTETTLYPTDVDGVTRYELGNVYAQVTENGEGEKTVDASDYLNLQKIADDTDIMVVFDANITSSSGLNDIKNTILDIDTNADAYDKIIEELSKDTSGQYKFYSTDDSSEYVVGVNKSDTAAFIRKSFNDNSVHDENSGSYSPYVRVISSDKVFGAYDGFPGSDFIISGENNYYSFSLGYFEDQPETDYSTGFHGMNIIHKALETGRALDIAINIGHIRTGGSHFNDGTTGVYWQ